MRAVSAIDRASSRAADSRRTLLLEGLQEGGLIVLIGTILGVLLSYAMRAAFAFVRVVVPVAAAAIVIAAITAIAALAPARRAATIEPMQAPRRE